LFNSYIFVREQAHNIQSVLQTPGVAWNIRYNGKPAVLRPEEFEIIERFITTGYFLETTGADVAAFNIGDKAKVIDGPLMGMAGTITGAGKDERFNILLEGIQQVIRIKLPATLLEKV
jgi:transcription antitermination factor NusG